jgi:hypothetical protein
MSIKNLVGKQATKSVPFMGTQLNIFKLSVAQVGEITNRSRGLDSADDDANLDLLFLVIQSGVDGGKELTKEEFSAFPVDELSKLSAAIMEFSGLGKTQSPGQAGA